MASPNRNLIQYLPKVSSASNRQILAATNYTLNIDRAIRKKSQSTNGGICGKLDTATFELLDSACLELYKIFPPEEGYCMFTSTEDKQGETLVQHTFKILRHADNRSTIGYTLNLYLTSNTLLLNGKDLDRFMNVHLSVLHEIMCISVKQFHYAPTLNNLLAEQMQQLLDQRENLLSQNGIYKGQQPNDSDIESVRLTPHIPQCSSLLAQNINHTMYAYAVPPSVDGIQTKVEISSDPADIMCTRCKRTCKTRAAVCQVGNHWIHYRCLICDCTIADVMWRD